MSSPATAPKLPKLKWKTATENEKNSAPMVRDDTWYMSHQVTCPDNTSIRIRIGNRKYQLTGGREAFFDGKKKVTSDLVLFRSNR